MDQVKNSGLSVNALAVFGSAIISGTSRYFNFGTTPGSTGYGIRDNNGVMEFKNTGGSWQSATTSAAQGIQSYFSLGSSSAVGQIRFSDGTTQTTAATNPSWVYTEYSTSCSGTCSRRSTNMGAHKFCALSYIGGPGGFDTVCGVSQTNGVWSLTIEDLTTSSSHSCKAICMD